MYMGVDLYYTFKTSDSYACPIFNTGIGDSEGMYRCLLDTGANLGVLCGHVNLSKLSAYKVVGIHKLTGFGKNFENCDILTFDEFCLKDANGNRLKYRNLTFLHSGRSDFGCDIVLPAAMFRFCNVNLDFQNGTIHIHSPKFAFQGVYRHGCGAPHVMVSV